MVRFGLRTRLLVGLAVLTLAGIGSAGAVALWSAEKIAVESEREFGRSIARTVALAHLPGSKLSDRQERDRLAPFLNRVRAEASAEEVSIVDASGSVVLSTDRQLVGTSVRDPAILLALQNHVSSTSANPRGIVYGEPIVDAAGNAVGAVRLVVRPFANDALYRSRIMVLVLTLVDAAFILVAGALLLGSAVVRPIERVRDLARRVAGGDFGHTVPVEGGGEIADLAHAANEMSMALRDHVHRLDDAREQLIRSEKLASVGRLAAGVAHEVGNPLAAIMGFSEILKDRDLAPEERISIATRMAAETARIHEILGELLDYARPTPEALEAVQVPEAVYAALSLVQHHKHWRAIDVDREIADDLPAVAASTSRLTQVLVNLLLNAADAMGGQGRIRVFARRAQADVEIGVSDTGPGVPLDLRNRIFDPFVTTKDPGEGSGLGLAICLSILESYGGAIRLEDTPGGGATFVVRLIPYS